MNSSADTPVTGKKFAFVVNPNSGRADKIDLEPVVRAVRAAGHEATLHITNAAGDALTIAEKADADVVVAVGGDGTVNEVLNGLLQGRATAFTVIPTGSANVLAADLGIRLTHETVLRLLTAGEERLFWPGVANGQAFAVMASVGFDADVVAAVDQNKTMKSKYGKIAYLLQAFRMFFVKQDSRTLTISVDGELFSGGGVIISRSRFYGGAFACAPNADLSDSPLTVTIMKSTGRLALLRYGIALFCGRLHRLKDVEVVLGTSIRVEAQLPRYAQLDGDASQKLPLVVEVAGKPVQLIGLPARADR
ncbi:MAG: diacylglycerol kinase family lipid kinase [Gammaproteobacteria bacterium]|nr:diacylglycerol kinase family lipid kinase [Gammaproteobacteria bacterium]